MRFVTQAVEDVGEQLQIIARIEVPPHGLEAPRREGRLGSVERTCGAVGAHLKDQSVSSPPTEAIGMADLAKGVVAQEQVAGGWRSGVEPGLPCLALASGGGLVMKEVSLPLGDHAGGLEDEPPCPSTQDLVGVRGNGSRRQRLRRESR